MGIAMEAYHDTFGSTREVDTVATQRSHGEIES
jgi:hypothetical protein